MRVFELHLNHLPIKEKLKKIIHFFSCFIFSPLSLSHMLFYVLAYEQIKFLNIFNKLIFQNIPTDSGN